jgi:hypothetical protein
VGPTDQDKRIAELLKSAPPMNASATTSQIVSLAFGNLKLEDDRVTREMIEEEVRRLRDRK